MNWDQCTVPWIGAPAKPAWLVRPARSRRGTRGFARALFRIMERFEVDDRACGGSSKVVGGTACCTKRSMAYSSCRRVIVDGLLGGMPKRD